MRQKFIVGLGNPGTTYARTRHNIGFRIVDAFVNTLDVTVQTEKKFQANVAKKDGMILATPQTMMNNSGHAVHALLAFYHATPHDLLLVYDDKDLPFGRLRVRTHGSSAGHHGAQSVIDALGTTAFTRLRIGVAGVQPIRDTADFVLQNFTSAEEQHLPTIISSAHHLIRQFCASEKPLPHHDVTATE